MNVETKERRLYPCRWETACWKELTRVERLKFRLGLAMSAAPCRFSVSAPSPEGALVRLQMELRDARRTYLVRGVKIVLVEGGEFLSLRDAKMWVARHPQKRQAA